MISWGIFRFGKKKKRVRKNAKTQRISVKGVNLCNSWEDMRTCASRRTHKQMFTHKTLDTRWKFAFFSSAFVFSML